MKKRIKLLNYLLLLALLLLPVRVNAAISGSYTINSSSSSVEIGNTVSVTFKISAKKMFYWQAYITYDTSKLQLVSGSTNFQGESDNISGQDSISKTLKFKAKKTGTAWIAINQSGDNNITSDSVDISFKKVIKNIIVKEKTIVKYSSNNYLKSLSIDGYNLSPKFNKDELNYKIELPENTEIIKVNATSEDSKSTINGIGKVKVNEGINTITIKVIAENGNEKKYIITAKVKEFEPIEIELNNKKYTVVRKKKELPSINPLYSETTTTINNEEIPAYTNIQTNYILVGLKDSDGNIKLYIYDKIKNTYNEYFELSFNKLTIYPLNKEFELSDQYKKTIIKINNIAIQAYKKSSTSTYSIFLGKNIESGEENIYMYDETENTIQKFDKSNLKNVKSEKNDNNIFFYVTILLTITLVITYTIILINLIKNNKKPTKIKI